MKPGTFFSYNNICINKYKIICYIIAPIVYKSQYLRHSPLCANLVFLKWTQLSIFNIQELLYVLPSVPQTGL